MRRSVPDVAHTGRRGNGRVRRRLIANGGAYFSLRQPCHRSCPLPRPKNLLGRGVMSRCQRTRAVSSPKRHAPTGSPWPLPSPSSAAGACDAFRTVLAHHTPARWEGDEGRRRAPPRTRRTMGGHDNRRRVCPRPLSAGELLVELATPLWLRARVAPCRLWKEGGTGRGGRCWGTRPLLRPAGAAATSGQRLSPLTCANARRSRRVARCPSNSAAAARP